MEVTVSNYPVTGENLEKLDCYIKEHEVNVFVKVYSDYSARTDGTPTIYESAGATIWDNVIRYCGLYYDGGCMEICMIENGEEFVLFHIEEGCHYISSDVGFILGV